MLAGELYLNNTDSHIHICTYIIYLFFVLKNALYLIISLEKKKIVFYGIIMLKNVKIMNLIIFFFLYV